MRGIGRIRPAFGAWLRTKSIQPGYQTDGEAAATPVKETLSYAPQSEKSAESE